MSGAIGDDLAAVKAIKVHQEVGYPYVTMPDHMPTHPLDRGGNRRGGHECLRHARWRQYVCVSTPVFRWRLAALCRVVWPRQ
jgi:hypothetical protein